MHDMDRTRAEFEGIDALEADFEYEEEGGFGEYEMYGQGEGIFSEQQEMELASQLLEITSDQELDQFLGNLIKKAGKAVGSFVKGPVGQALGGVIKQAARTALPMAGAALGNMVLPGIGGVVGGKLASAAGSMFGLELEGLSNEDREFEIARRYVRLVGEATKNAVQAPPQAPPAQVAKQAVAAAARKLAPGLLQSGALARNGQNGHGGPQGEEEYGGYGYGGSSSAYASQGSQGNGLPSSGRWYRRGRRIVLMF